MQPEVLRRADLSRVLDTLNFLGSVPWRINEPLLRVVEAVWAAGGGVVEIPRLHNHVIPPEPVRPPRRQQPATAGDTSSAAAPATASEEGEGDDDDDLLAEAAYKQELQRHRNIAKKLVAKNNDLKSVQADMRIKLRIAQDLRNEENIYFPLNLGACVAWVRACSCWCLSTVGIGRAHV